MNDLKNKAPELYEKPELEKKDIDGFAEEFIDKLNKGGIRAAEKNSESDWVANEWIKKGILLIFLLFI